MRVKFSIGTGYVGCEREEVLDLPDDFTDKEIEEEFEIWLGENTDRCWTKLKDGE